MQTNAIDILYSRPGMYLAPYEKVDAASFIVNFLIAVFEHPTLRTPNCVDITIAGQYFSIQAKGCRLPELRKESRSLSSIFDIAHFRQPFFDKSYSLGYMRPIVWFAEYGFVELAIADKVFRQAFWHGRPLGQQSELPLAGKRATIGFNFTLPTEPFEQVTLEIDRLRRVITSWEEERFARAVVGRPKLHQQWCQQSKYHHSLRISTNHTINPAQIMETSGRIDSPQLARSTSDYRLTQEALATIG